MAASRPLTCSICLTDQLKEPKFLQCHHTFCRQCLQFQLNAQDQKRTLACPNCRIVTKLPANGVEGLTNNFYIEAFREYANRHEGGVKYCDVCQLDVTAAVRCEECEQNYCRGCMKTHLLMAQCKEHTLQVLRETRVKSPVESSRLTCTVHEGKEMAFCCADDDSVLCSQCWEEGHRGHRIKPVDEYAADRREYILNEIDSVKQTHLALLQDRSDALRLKVNTQATVDETINKVRTTRDEIKRRLDVVAVKIIEEIGVTSDGMNDLFDQYENSMKAQTDSLLAVMESTKEIVDTSPDIDMVRVRNDLYTSLEQEKYKCNTKPEMNAPMLIVADVEHVLISSLTEETASPATNILHPTLKTRVVKSFITDCENPGCLNVMQDGIIMVCATGDRYILGYASGGHLLYKYKTPYRVGALLQCRDGRKLLTEAKGKRMAIRHDPEGETVCVLLDNKAKGLSLMRSVDNMVVFGWDSHIKGFANKAGLSFYTSAGECIGNITVGDIYGNLERVCEMRNGNFVLSTKKCVNVVNKNGSLKYSYTFKGTVYDILTDANGHVIVLNEYQGGTRVSLFDAELFLVKDIFAWQKETNMKNLGNMTMCMDGDGSIWIAISKALFCLKYII